MRVGRGQPADTAARADGSADGLGLGDAGSRALRLHRSRHAADGVRLHPRPGPARPGPRPRGPRSRHSA
ncbi:hypothetical protein BGK67_28735 [Streptomyces subrutilus]|uniref:Uncharacterized protein n=1 Tax=Streptomyces subrutilus TaxID=36818 RepID=A0A1E5PZ69_9ACTN|nr:hypothetical protein BGK67_28735 [Streptomyces subrutilus]